MKFLRHIAVAGCALVLLCQCASQDEVRRLNYQLRAVNQKLEEVKTHSVQQIQKRQASSVNKIDQVADEVLQLKSQLEDNNHVASQFREQTKEDLATLHSAVDQLRNDSETRMKSLEDKLDTVAASLEKLQQQQVREAEARAREAARRAEAARRKSLRAARLAREKSSRTKVGNRHAGLVKVTPTKRKMRVNNLKVVAASPGKGNKPAKEKVAPGSAQKKKGASREDKVQTVEVPDTTSAPFSEAMQLFKTKKYKEAYKRFEQVLAGNPKGAKAAETLYYMGECLFNQGDYDLAILDYQKVISNHAKDPHTPLALLKQGMSFEKLTDLETAKIIYKKLLNDYAGTPEAAQARRRLENL